MNSHAPIALFAFRRPDHLKRTLDALMACPEAAASALTIYCDGPRRDADVAAVQAVRDLARRCTGFLSLNVIESEHNRGLASSIIGGVGEQLSIAEQVIVVEDDLVVSPHFLRYMNDALALYADEPKVASIHGYSYPVGTALPETYFLRGADCWGWATWRRAWPLFRLDGAELLAELRGRGLTRRFDLDGGFGFTRMLEQQIEGRNDSWAIRWHASCFLAERLTLYPGRSLVHNIGNDASGTHRSQRSNYAQAVATAPVRVERLPLDANEVARQAFVRFFRDSRSGPVRRAAQAVRRVLEGGRR
jgi:hypothetical protein